MMRTFFIFSFSLVFSFFSIAQEVNIAKLDSLLDLLDKEHQAMGSFAISQNGKIVYKRSIGYSQFSETSKQPNNDQTKYQIGSITKTYTAALIFQLIDEKKLTLDTRLYDFYPEIPNAKLITIKDLLSHRSGLMDYVNETEDKVWLTKPQEKKTLLSVIEKGKTNFEPNTKSRYCNSGYLLLAYILEDITHQSYHDLLEQRIVKKLGLKNTTSYLANSSAANVASSYSYHETWKPITDFNFTNVIGVGDIQSTPEDMIVFNEALLNGKLVSERSLMLMKTTIEGTGMGLMKIPFGSKSSYGHGGATYGTRSSLSTFEDSKTSFAFCDNGNVYPQNDIAIGLLSIYYNQPYTLPDFKAGYVPANLDQYTGVYSGAQFPLKITIFKDNSTLMAQATGQGAFPLRAVSEHVFEFKQAYIVLEFNHGINTMVLKQMGGVFSLTKEK